jgi:hypothetical protein
MTPSRDSVKSSPKLEEHAQTIRKLSKRIAADIIGIGRHLAEARQLCGHGQWLLWLEREFRWTDRHARNFIAVYDMSKSENFSDSCLPLSVLYKLAAPSTPEAIRAEVLARAESGERVSHKEVVAKIAEAKAAAQSADDGADDDEVTTDNILTLPTPERPAPTDPIDLNKLNSRPNILPAVTSFESPALKSIKALFDQIEVLCDKLNDADLARVRQYFLELSVTLSSRRPRGPAHDIKH